VPPGRGGMLGWKRNGAMRAEVTTKDTNTK
jgi:hypothetical protein